MRHSWPALAGKLALAGASAGVGLALLAPAAHADTRYTTEIQVGGTQETAGGPGDNAAKVPTLRTTTFIKGKRERSETVMEMGAMKSNTVTLTLCDTHQVVTMDPDLKLYTLTPMDSSPATSPAGDGAAPAGQAKPPKEKEDTGRVLTTYAIQDLGTEKVGNLNARHFMVTMRMERSGCAGKGDNTMKMETWVAPGQIGGLDCPERVPSSAPRELRNEKGCRITFETRGDTGLLRDVFSGIVVRQRMYSGDKVVMAQEVKDISSDPLDASLFAPPSDYKQVSPQEFAEAKRKAQMASLTAPTPGGSGSSGATGSAGDAAPKRRRGGLLGGLGGAVGGAIPGLGGRLGGLGGGVLSALGGQGGLGGIASMLGSGVLGGIGGYSPVSLPGNAGQALSLVGSLMTK
jgi:hypothetical protein